MTNKFNSKYHNLIFAHVQCDHANLFFRAYKKHLMGDMYCVWIFHFS